MMRRSTTTPIALAGAIAFAGVLAGCGGGGSSGGAGTAASVPSSESSESGVSTVAETTSPSTEPSTTVTSLDTVAPATDVAGAGSTPSEAAAVAGDCLVGDWVVTSEQMDAFYDGVMGTLEAPLGIDTDGSAPLSFAADGTYEWAPDFALVVEIAGQSGTGEVAGTITGTWTAADGIVTTSSDVNALTLSIMVNGVSFDGADLGNGLLDSSPVNGVTYSCDGPTPVLDFRTADPAVTVPVTLTPA